MMKNKTIISILTLCVMAAAVSCEKSGREVMLPGANLSVRLRVDHPELTRTTGSSYLADSLHESSISSLTLCLVAEDGLGDDSLVTIVSGSRNIAWKSVTGDYDYEVNAVVPDSCTGNYLLYVIAGMPSWMEIKTYADLCGAFSGTTDQIKGCWGGNNFLMVNKQDEVVEDGDDPAGVHVTLDPDDGEKVEASVTIERLAAKIRVNDNPYMEVAPLLTQVLCSTKGGGADTKGAIVAMSLEGYALFNCVNSFNLIQRWADASGTGDMEKLLVSPSSDYETPYPLSDGYYDNDPDSLTFQKMGTIFYCMENNSPYYSDLVSGESDATKGTKMKGRVTGLVFKARAGFARSYTGDVIIKEPLPVDDYEVDWETKGSSDVEYGTLYQYKGNYYGDLACLLRNNSTSLSGLTEESTVEQIRAKGVKVYEDGYMYYNYWLEDPNYTDDGVNYLSVMRNTFYDITITAINSLGDEFPCGEGYDDEDPISVDVPKFSISMDIPDWVDKEGKYVIQ